MGLELGHVTNNPADAIVLVSRLEAGGFTPVLFNQYHGMIAIGYVNAIDGFRIMLPDHQIADAREYLASVQPITDFDPIPEKRTREIVYATIMSNNPFYPLILLPPLVQLSIVLSLILLSWLISSEPIITLTLQWAIMFCIIAVIAHARYVAVPRMRKTYEP